MEELAEADLLLHVVDITHKNAANQYLTVEEELNKLNLKDKPRITVFNKLDLALSSEAELKALTLVPCIKGPIMLLSKNMALISAAKGWGIDKLLSKVVCYLAAET